MELILIHPKQMKNMFQAFCKRAHNNRILLNMVCKEPKHPRKKNMFLLFLWVKQINNPVMANIKNPQWVKLSKSILQVLHNSINLNKFPILIPIKQFQNNLRNMFRHFYKQSKTFPFYHQNRTAMIQMPLRYLVRQSIS